MLGKNTLEMVVHPGSVYYRCLFLVQKVTGGWKPTIELLAMLLLLSLVWRWLCWYWVDQERWHNAVGRPQGCILPDSHSPRLSTIPLDFAIEQSLPVQGTLLQSFYSSPSLHKSVFSGFRVGSQARDAPSSVSQQLVDHHRFIPSSAGTLGAPFQHL